ncbi:hypothetical protein [Alicyclobacillus macrosporangiidus]|uniref:hypothetical protein n=1 Tax=Alicyclobacillus macrosporangiidus TaxID=392015 RepID=UPI0012DEA351|nr:hypothetical protein [Alicyclobacillus macrosporangiidus]
MITATALAVLGFATIHALGRHVFSMDSAKSPGNPYVFAAAVYAAMWLMLMTLLWLLWGTWF